LIAVDSGADAPEQTEEAVTGDEVQNIDGLKEEVAAVTGARDSAARSVSR
jgi:hypothetical protein